jgi:hypothetical protein
MSVNVSSGANSESLNVGGQTVGEIRSRFATALNISPAAAGQINGETVDDYAVVDDGDRLSFVKETAEKG